MINQSSLLNFEKAMEIKTNLELLKSISQKQNAFELFKKNSKFVLWTNIDNKRYKLYLINGVNVEFSEIISVDEFNDEKNNELVVRIRKFRENDENKTLYDKSYIDYINIIYSYIYKSGKVNYINI